MFDLFGPKLTILDPFEIIWTHLDQFFVPILIVALIVNFVYFLLIFNLILLYFISVYSDFVKPESSRDLPSAKFSQTTHRAFQKIVQFF